MSELHLIARFSIQDGKLETFRDLAGQCMAVTREEDTGTLQYAWYFNAEQTECIVLETYRDSEAIIEHATHLGPLLADISAVTHPIFEIYGDPSDELLELLAALPHTVYRPFQSL